MAPLLPANEAACGALIEYTARKRHVNYGRAEVALPTCPKCAVMGDEARAFAREVTR